MSVVRAAKMVTLSVALGVVLVHASSACNAVLGIDDPTIIGAEDGAPLDGIAPGRDAASRGPDVADGAIAADADDCRRPPGGACGVVPQCGCAETETCDVLGAGQTSCTTAGLAKLGYPCMVTSSCQRGLTCIYGACHAFCETPGSTCAAPSKGECRQVKNVSSVAIPNLVVCAIDCELTDPQACGGTTASGTAGCLVDSAGKTDCSRAGVRQVGEVCSPADQCGPALVCVTRSTMNKCVRWCRVGVDADCGNGVCAGFVSKVLVKGVEFGGCPD